MVTKALAVLWIMIIMVSSSCSLYLSEADYNNGKTSPFRGVNGPEIAKIQNNREDLQERKTYFDSSMKALESGSAEAKPTGSGQHGFKGVINNLSPVRANFVITPAGSKIMAKSYYLSPGQLQEDDLLPGDYSVSISVGSVFIGEQKFTVGVNQKNYKGMLNTYWFVAYDPCPTRFSYFQVGSQQIYCDQQ